MRRGADGWWVRPTVLVDADPQGRICREEIFGPVVAVAPFETEEEAVELASDMPYGSARCGSPPACGRVPSG